MTNKHHTEMLVNGWRNNNHNSGKMELGEGIEGRSLVSMTELATGTKSACFKCLLLVLPPQPNFHVKVIVPLKNMQHI